MIRFIHSGDLHLGKRFGGFSGDLPGRLREARHGVIARLAQHARDHGASDIVLAGDTFDTETPAPDIRRQALKEMGQHAPIRWVILPGNHDSLQATQLWSTLRAEAPDNVVLAMEPRPVAFGSHAVLLPSPCTARRPGRDLTDWMESAATPDGALRIGIAHGAVQSFSEQGLAADVIAPDRAKRAGLAYLALGDWHGTIAIDPRTHYCGSPEPDRFKHDRPGSANLVTIEGVSAMPTVTQLETASFAWRRFDLHLLDAAHAAQELDAILPDERHRRHTLARVVATGRGRLAERTALSAAVEMARPDFAFLDLDESGLATDCDVEDLDRIDRAGALREAADALLAESQDAGRSADEREIARAALARLYGYAQTVAL